MAQNNQKQRVKFGDLLKKAVQGFKHGATKQKVYAAICIVGAVALLIWWITIVASFF